MQESKAHSEQTIPLQTFKGKSIISISNGQIIGTVNDILIDHKALTIAAIVTSKSTLLSRDIDVIPAAEIQVWGEDVILVSGPIIIRKKEEAPELAESLSVSGQIKRRNVFSLNGIRVGEISDLVIDAEGNLVSYEFEKVTPGMAEVMVDSPEGDRKYLPLELTHALGKDVLIVDLHKSQAKTVTPEIEE